MMARKQKEEIKEGARVRYTSKDTPPMTFFL
jgi:hypothetical protein